MKMSILMALFAVAVAASIPTGANAGSPAVDLAFEPTPTAPPLPASQWDPRIDVAKGPPGGDA